VQHWDGTQFNAIDLPISLWGQNQINKIWGNSSSDIYLVGNSGAIAHYNGTSWSKIESGTNLQFLDIYGSGGEILAVCTQNNPPGRGIFSITGNSTTQISSTPIQYELFGAWFVPNRHYYVVGSGIYEKRLLSESSWKDIAGGITRNFTTKMRGNGLNDVFVVGAFGECLHYNGVTWKSYIDETGFSSGAYTSVAVKGNLVVVGGGANANAIITIGRR
jgi:hypothetical protein